MVVSGYVHTDTLSFENTSFSLRLGLPSTLRCSVFAQGNRSVFKTLSKRIHLKTPFSRRSVDSEPGAFLKR